MTTTETYRPIAETTLDGADAIVVVHSSHTDDPPLPAMLQVLPCRVTGIPVGPEMGDALAARSPNVLVIDHSTDDFNVVRLIRELYQLTSGLIVVIAAPTEFADEAWIIERLDDGAHVVISAAAPGSFVLAQLRAVLRAAPRPQHGPEQLVVGDVTIDLGAHELIIDGERVSCSPVLYSLLVVLATSPNRVLARETLLARVWGVSPTASHLRRVRIAASQLRRLLGSGPRRPRIETVARVGYCLAVDS
ncbi:winged helix-turn-helix domain-containing protein [Desertimonas flava]|uniref:winged helix-turn-helix domain-containing protein n=1 Tax=Desertimonas flava TaxID=2064846 RepID=UPI000E349810|nr:winged helix-turn-helix domain-containing protein [Desertimonas flava]